MDNYSLSDLRAAVDGGNDNWGGGAWWIIILFLFVLMDECSKRELFIAAVQTLTQEEQRRLWKELEKHGIIKRKSPDCI